MPKAIWNGQVIAESDDAVVVEGNHYFPADSVNSEFLVDSGTHSVCPWKGVASYYSLQVGDKQNPDAAWYYPHPSPLAGKVRDRVAFWRGVQIVDTGNERHAATPARRRGFLGRLGRAA